MSMAYYVDNLRYEDGKWKYTICGPDTEIFCISDRPKREVKASIKKTLDRLNGGSRAWKKQNFLLNKGVHKQHG